MATKSSVKIATDSLRGDYIFAPVLVCDLDGTVRYNHKEPDGFIDGPETVAVYDDVEDILWNYRNEGYIVSGVSNQGGVAYGFKSQFNARREVDAMIDQFDRNPFFSVQLCFEHPGGSEAPHDWRSMRRKPKTGMLAILEQELYENDILPNWDESIVVGDREEDRDLASNANIDFIGSKQFFNRD